MTGVFLSAYVAGTGTALAEGAGAPLLVDSQRRLVVSLAGGGGSPAGAVNIAGVARGATAGATVTATTQGADHVGLDVQLRDSAGTEIAPALDATLTGGTAKFIARGGAKGATGAADVTSTAIDADHQALDVIDKTPSPTVYANRGAATAASIVAASARVFAVSCQNAATGTRYLQLFNKTVAPSASDVPALEWPIAQTSFLLVGDEFFTRAGVKFSSGLAFGFSTTQGQYQPASAADQSTQVIYT